MKTTNVFMNITKLIIILRITKENLLYKRTYNSRGSLSLLTVLMVKCWVLQMDYQTELKLGGIHWESHLYKKWEHIEDTTMAYHMAFYISSLVYQHWENQLGREMEGRYAPLMAVQVVVVMLNLMDPDWYKHWEQYWDTR